MRPTLLPRIALAPLALGALAGCTAAPGTTPADPGAGAETVDCAAKAAQWGSEAKDVSELPAFLRGAFSILPTCLLQVDPGKYSALWYGVSEEQIQVILEEARAAAADAGLEHFFGEDGDNEMWEVERDGHIDSILFERWTDRFELETDLNATLG